MTTMDELVAMGEDERYGGKQGWKVYRAGTTVSYVRDGYARVVVTWIGGELFTVAWEFGMGTGEVERDWRVQVYTRDEVVVETDMTLNAMWR